MLTLSSDTAVVIPSAPVKFNVPDIKETVSVPVSADIDKEELTDSVPATVKRPSVSTVNVGICVDEP